MSLPLLSPANLWSLSQLRRRNPIAWWQEQNSQPDAQNHIRHVPAKGSKKGCVLGKGGPQNSNCAYRGVWQRTCGKLVVEIREPNCESGLWMGTFPIAEEATLAYDEAARAMYGAYARLNLSEHGESTTMTTMSHHSNTAGASTTEGEGELELKRSKEEQAHDAGAATSTAAGEHKVEDAKEDDWIGEFAADEFYLEDLFDANATSLPFYIDTPNAELIDAWPPME
ncbi:hypothetical protein Cni_G14011 [Canna indica]|uniref:AP2/ERF domain-containing protein n=1 Tax=Canna indica TaxID=4628 RepID=A0AAQ3KC69_9LILI|nr:hypothetical protein Cni_G14011 [Canna indica]